MQMIRNITEGKFKFGSPEWDDISELPKDLVSFVRELSTSNFSWKIFGTIAAE